MLLLPGPCIRQRTASAVINREISAEAGYGAAGYCLVNDAMTKGTSLETLCETGNTAEELRAKLKELFSKDFKAEEAQHRAEHLKKLYDNKVNGQKMVDLIYKQ